VERRKEKLSEQKGLSVLLKPICLETTVLDGGGGCFWGFTIQAKESGLKNKDLRFIGGRIKTASVLNGEGEIRTRG